MHGIAAHYDYKSSLEHISPFHAANIDALTSIESGEGMIDPNDMYGHALTECKTTVEIMGEKFEKVIGARCKEAEYWRVCNVKQQWGECRDY